MYFSSYNVLCFLTKFVVMIETTLEQAYDPAVRTAADTNSRLFHCCDDARIAAAAAAAARNRSTLFHAWNALTALRHPLQ